MRYYKTQIIAYEERQAAERDWHYLAELVSNLITACKSLLGLKSVWEHYYSTTMSITGLTYQTSVGVTLHQILRGIQETCISGQFQSMNEQVLIKVPAENNHQQSSKTRPYLFTV